MGTEKNVMDDKTESDDDDDDSATSVSIDAVERMQTIGKILKFVF